MHHASGGRKGGKEFRLRSRIAGRTCWYRMPRRGFVPFKLVDAREAFLIRTARYVALEHALVLLQMRPVIIVS